MFPLHYNTGTSARGLLSASSTFFFAKCSMYRKIIRAWTLFNPFWGNSGCQCCELIYLFSSFGPQDGIKPMWEDDRNRRGGRWLITLSKQQRKSDLDRFWLETVRRDSEQTVPSPSHLVAAVITKHLEARSRSRWNKDAINRIWTSIASYGFMQRRSECCL